MGAIRELGSEVQEASMGAWMCITTAETGRREPGEWNGSSHAGTGVCMEPYVPSARGKGDGGQFHKFLKNAGFLLSARNPPVDQCELSSGYLHCLRRNRERSD